MKVIDTPTLKDLNERSRSAGRSKNLTDSGIESLDADGKHIISSTFVHNDRELRSTVLAKTRDRDLPQELVLDMSFEDYADLPEAS